MAGKKRIRRLVKVLLWIVVGILAFLGAVAAALRAFFPERRLVALIERQSALSGWPVRIEAASINPFGRIDLQGVHAAFQPDSSAPPFPFFSLQRASVRFRLASLMRRHFSISEVTLDQPQVSLGTEFLQALQKWTAEQPKRKTESKPLPVDVLIQKLELRNFRLKTALPEPGPVREIGLEGLNVDVSKFQVPSGFQKSAQGFRGQIRVFSENGRVLTTAFSREYRFDPGLELTFQWGRRGNWTLKGTTDLRFVESPGLSVAGLRLVVKGSSYAEAVELDTAEFSIGGQTAAALRGRFSLAGKSPSFECDILETPLSLEPIKTLLVEILPETLAAFVKPVGLTGTVLPAKGRISGTLENFRFNLVSQVRETKVEYSVPTVLVEGLQGDLSVEGSGSQSGIRTGTVQGTVGLPRVRIRPNDTLEIALEKTELGLKSRLNERALPVQGEFSAAIGGLFGGHGRLQGTWELASQPQGRIEDVKAEASFAAESLDLAAMPGNANGIRGIANVKAELNASHSRDIVVRVFGEAPAVTIPFQGRPESLPPLRAEAVMRWHAESGFRKWVLDTTAIRALNLFTANLTGEMAPESQVFEFRLRNGVFENSPLPALLPKPVLDPLGGLALRGREILDMTVRSHPAEKGVVVSVSGALRLEGGGLDLPAQSVRVDGLEGQVRFEGTPEAMSGHGSVLVKSVFLEKMRAQPITGSRADFSWTYSIPERFDIREGRFTVPDLGAGGTFLGRADSLMKVPVVTGHAEFRFQAPDTVGVTPLLAVKGRASGWATLESVPPDQKRFRITGEATADSLTLFSRPFIEIRNVQGTVPFSFGIDSEKGGLTAFGLQEPFEGLAYAHQRDLYASLFPSISRMRIETIQAAGYSLDDLNLDVQIQDGLVQVPWFSGQLLGGNLGGTFWLALNDGNPSTMAYFVKADVARINSATLVKSSVPDEETELDVSLDFRGRGLDPKTGIDVEGAMHMTKIGPQFASTLLQGIDPQGADRQIRLTKRLFDFWYKPKLFSFELRHGYVYPSLFLSQPWFSPLRIPEKIEYGRLPLEFFMRNPNLQMKR